MQENGFVDFIRTLNEYKVPREAAKTALTELAGLVPLGRVNASLVMPRDPSELSKPLPPTKHFTLFENAEPDTAVKAEYVFTPGFGGQGTLRAYPPKGKDWDEAERELILAALIVLAMKFDRFATKEALDVQRVTHFLTGLPNVGGFVRHLDELAAKGMLPKFHAFYFNIRNFMFINWRFGPHEGDNVLRRYARVLAAFPTEEGETISHFGGDNFAALIRNERYEAFLRLLGKCTVYGVRAGRRMPVILSAVAGVLPIREDIKPFEIISHCSTAMNIAKHKAHIPFVLCTKEMAERMIQARHLLSLFPAAFERREFIVYYQPKVDTKTLTLIGAEALVRWRHGGRLVPPGEFLPTFEESGDITDIDFYVLDCVCRQLRKWMEQGLSPVPVSVNFSRQDLEVPTLPDKIVNILRRHGIDKELIQVEITETTNAREHKRLVSFLQAMHEHGISLAIDDFGTGYSSFSTLREFPVDVIKIDQSFVKVSLNTQTDQVVLKNLIRMVQQLGMNIVTEGVETIRQMEFLQEIGCTVVQGFLFSKPIPPEEYAKLLKDKRYDPPEKDFGA